MSIKSLIRYILVGVVLPLVIGGAALAWAWPDLPAQVATHWGANGQADGFMNRSTGLVMWNLGVLAGLWAMLTAAVAGVPASAPGARGIKAIPAATAWGVAMLTIGSAVAQRGDVATARPLSGWWVVLALAAAVLGAAVGYAAGDPAPAMPARDRDPDPSAPRLANPTAGSVWWTGVAPAGRGMMMMAAGMVLFGLVMAWVVDPWAALLILPVFGVLVASSYARVTVGQQKVVVSGGLFGWPRLSVDLDSVAAAMPTTTTIKQWGGLGLRSRPGATGIITRGGDALELQRTDDTTVMITVDDAHNAAATINSLLERV